MAKTKKVAAADVGDAPFEVVEKGGAFVIQHTENGAVFGRHATRKFADQQVVKLSRFIESDGEVGIPKAR